MGFVMGSLLIFILSFPIAIALVRPLFALLYPRRKTPALSKTVEVTAGWVVVALPPAVVYTLIFQWIFGNAIKTALAKWFPHVPAYVEPAAAFGFIYAVVTSVCALVILSSDSAASER
ncbi:hypothetical protein ACI48D_08795 [Massilia sp. LXY-6]|uniref:hypothetical protein n=1 Tax=Massilia sp. LXY-6 TaxID=3379823 RepID=UPI003EE148A4